MSVSNGKYAMINLPSWLFLGSFEKLRMQLIKQNHIDSLIHMGRGIFGIDWGSTAFTCSKIIPTQKTGIYFRLHKRNFQHIYYYHIEQLFLNALHDHSFKYDFDSYREDGEVAENITFESSEDGNKLYYIANQSKFEQIPGSPIAYWASEKIFARFAGNLALSAVCKPTQGLATADNARFVRYWSEVNLRKVGFGCRNSDEALASKKKWFFYNKGGATRKWFGNHELVVNWENDGREIKSFKNAVVRNPNYYFKESVSWSLTSSIGCAFRYNPDAAIFDVNGMSLFPINKEDTFFLLGSLNTNFYNYIAKIINPTLALQCGDVAKFPAPSDINLDFKRVIGNISEECFSIARQDWDTHETSWDFAKNELISIAQGGETLEARVDQYEQKWEHLFMQLHANEEELNRQFIDIYGLQDELTPDVPLSEITILQQGEINVTETGITFNHDVLIKQLISYAVGCMMGRYRLDRPGLAIAHPDAKPEEYAPYTYHGETFEIDDDGILPLLPVGCAFTDNANLRFKHWLELAFGPDSLVENLNFVERCLGKPIDEYFVKDFWKDHKKMYQNRPIYWLFASRKGAFQCIAYMHRMNAYTVERIRTNYLLPHIEWLVQRQQELQQNAANLSTAERRSLDNITKQIAECREYHDRLHVIADKQIAFDLDDGVVVNYAKFGDVVSKLK
jgi:hypothetical protein